MSCEDHGVLTPRQVQMKDLINASLDYRDFTHACFCFFLADVLEVGVAATIGGNPPNGIWVTPWLSRRFSGLRTKLTSWIGS